MCVLQEGLIDVRCVSGDILCRYTISSRNLVVLSCILRVYLGIVSVLRYIFLPTCHLHLNLAQIGMPGPRPGPGPGSTLVFNFLVNVNLIVFLNFCETVQSLVILFLCEFLLNKIKQHLCNIYIMHS